jgi:cob(I)alamin adenosyltransferase
MAIRIDKVYTRTGDEGETHLALGGRIAKDSIRIETVGAVDELNSALGVAREELRSLAAEGAAIQAELDPLLERVQRKLFDLGGYLATAPDRFKEGMPSVSEEDIRLLESEIDRWGEQLPPLTSFILPGGGRLGALLHVARASCRRAEREAVRLHRLEPIPKPVLPFLNRLSDWLFVASRRAAKLQGVAETFWKAEHKETRNTGKQGKAGD